MLERRKSPLREEAKQSILGGTLTKSTQEIAWRGLDELRQLWFLHPVGKSYSMEDAKPLQLLDSPARTMPSRCVDNPSGTQTREQVDVLPTEKQKNHPQDSPLDNIKVNATSQQGSRKGLDELLHRWAPLPGEEKKVLDKKILEEAIHSADLNSTVNDSLRSVETLLSQSETNGSSQLHASVTNHDVGQNASPSTATNGMPQSSFAHLESNSSCTSETPHGLSGRRTDSPLAKLRSLETWDHPLPGVRTMNHLQYAEELRQLKSEGTPEKNTTDRCCASQEEEVKLILTKFNKMQPEPSLSDTAHREDENSPQQGFAELRQLMPPSTKTSLTEVNSASMKPVVVALSQTEHTSRAATRQNSPGHRKPSCASGCVSMPSLEGLRHLWSPSPPEERNSSERSLPPEEEVVITPPKRLDTQVGLGQEVKRSQDSNIGVGSRPEPIGPQNVELPHLPLSMEEKITPEMKFASSKELPSVKEVVKLHLEPAAGTSEAAPKPCFGRPRSRSPCSRSGRQPRTLEGLPRQTGSLSSETKHRPKVPRSTRPQLPPPTDVVGWQLQFRVMAKKARRKTRLPILESVDEDALL